MPSKQQNLITGLNLLRLLVQNRIAEFHTELELIPQQVFNPFAAHTEGYILLQFRRLLHVACRCNKEHTSSMLQSLNSS